jgi:hypothetical protein
MVALVSAGIVLAVAPSAYGQRRSRGGGGGGGGGGRSAQPSPQAQAVMADRKEIDTINTELTGINTKIADATKKAMAEEEKTEEYISAQKAIDDANDAVKKARDAVMAKLNTRADYKDAKAKETAAQAKMDQMKTDGMSTSEREAQSKLVLDLGGATSKMERDALANDSDYQAAQKKLADATAAMKVIKDKVVEKLKENDDFKALLQQQSDTKQKLVDANKKLTTDQAAVAR